MSVGIETPYPIEGTLQPTEYGRDLTIHGAETPSEWVTNSEHGNLADRAEREIRRRHGEGAKVEVTWYEDGTFDLGEIVGKTKARSLADSSVDVACVNGDGDDELLLKVSGEVVKTDESGARMLASEIDDRLNSEPGADDEEVA